MNKRNFFLRIIRKTNKMLSALFPERNERKELTRQAKKIGKQLQLKKHNFIFSCSTLSSIFYLPLYKTDYIQQNILVDKNYYEIENLTMICKEWENGRVGRSLRGKCVVDIGANIGNHTLYFFQECGISEAICFEPLKNTFEILKKNIDINGLKNKVTLYNVAVGNDCETASIHFFDKTNIGATILTKDAHGCIPIISIDSLQIQQDVSLIKIDVEGFETFVIQGCIETIRKYKPYIMIEIRDEHLADISNILSPLGYKYYHTNIINYLFYIKSDNNE